MFKRVVGCLLLIMATANIAEAIDGDLDLDGDVDFQDFFTFSTKFPARKAHLRQRVLIPFI